MALTDQELVDIALQFESRRQLKAEMPQVLNLIYKRKIYKHALSHMKKERVYVADEQTSRVCTSCGVDKPNDQYHASGSGSLRLRSECKQCCHAKSTSWRKSNPDRSREIVRDSYKRYPEKERDKQRRYRKQKPEVYAARDMLKRVLSATNQTKRGRTADALGYTAAELRAHLESLFVDGMSWDNRGEWHIDHIVPVAVMVRDGITDPAIINALTNLQPLWAKDNLAKIWEARADGQRSS